MLQSVIVTAVVSDIKAFDESGEQMISRLLNSVTYDEERKITRSPRPCPHQYNGKKMEVIGDSK